MAASTLIQDSKDILQALGDNPNVLILVLNLEGTGITKQRLLEWLTPVLARGLSDPDAPHIVWAGKYKAFLREREDNTSLAALYDRIAAVKYNTAVLHDFPLSSSIFGRRPDGTYIETAADLLALTREEIARLCEEVIMGPKATRPQRALEDCAELEKWFKDRFDMGFLD